MSVNALQKEQVYTLVNEIAKEAQAQTDIQAVDLSSFITVGTSILAVGVEPALEAITNVLQRSIIAVRPYDEKFKGLQWSNDMWGAITRKINFADREAEEEHAYLEALTEGDSVDPWTVRKPNVLQTNFYGSDIYSNSYTVYEYQVREAFASPEAFGSFLSGLYMHMVNERTQWLEVLKKSILVNAIAGKNALGQDVINLREEYNTATGSSFTKEDLMKPENFKGFMDWCYARVSKVSREFTSRSQKYQAVIDNKPIMRHTPYNDQRVYMLAEFLEAMSSRVYANTYHENFLTYADVEAVDYWQAINQPDEIKATPVVIDNTGAYTTGQAQDMSGVVGVIFDRDALGYNIFHEGIYNTGLNSKGLYFNIHYHMDIRLNEDLTEKIAVFVIA